MDVQCERCKTEYEFDDALVSGRGTTVKCTNCGFQFKIRRASEPSPGLTNEQDRWLVRTTEGRDVVFTSLRELQRAILAKQVGKNDSLTRGNALPRALGAIAELEPFFEERRSAAPPAAQRIAGPPRPEAKRTLVGHAGTPPPPREKMPSRPPPPPGAKRTTLRPIMQSSPGITDVTPPPAPPPVPEMRPRIDTIRPPPTANAAVPPPAPQTLPRPFAVLDDSGARPFPPPPAMPAPMLKAVLTPMPPPPAPAYTPTPAASNIVGPTPGRSGSLPPPDINPLDVSSALPPPTNPVRRAPDYDDPMRAAMNSMGDSMEDIRLPVRSRRVGGWVVAFVLVLGVGVLGVAVGRPYLEKMNKPAASATAPLDARAQQFLSEGEKALADGSLDAAKENFDKASALAEGDARVLLDLARLAAVRADLAWLRTRILPPEATDDMAAAKATLDEVAPKARKAADAALAAAPDDVAAVRAKIDAARIAGDRDAARSLVTKIIGNASQPETAYVLAALDLAETEPLWPMVIERLRLAAAGEGNAGRARAALVYALARSGDVGAAKQEIERLAALPHPHPLVGALRAFVTKTPVAKVGDGGVAPVAAATATVDVASLPRHGGGGGGSAGSGGGGGGAGGGFAGASDPRTLLAQAATAQQAHDYDRARALYSAALAQNPRDSEALAGLGDVSHAMHDLAGAIGYYRRALAVNPVYLPALVGEGDAKWESGDQAGGQKIYRDITDRFPEGTYPARVKQRAEAATPNPGANAPSPAGTDDQGASQ